MIRVTVLYPGGEGQTFDAGYYVDKHMKMVRDRLGAAGLVRAEVDKGLAGGAPGAPAPFVYVCHLYFNSLPDFQKAMGAHGKEIMGDVPNYTNVRPQIQISEIVA
jgi:uncharacterized protein (TIGR02118 family)